MTNFASRRQIEMGGGGGLNKNAPCMSKKKRGKRGG